MFPLRRDSASPGRSRPRCTALCLAQNARPGRATGRGRARIASDEGGPLDESLLLKWGDVEDRHWWYAGRNGIVADAALAQVPAKAVDVLEVGCGSGGFLAGLSDVLPDARLRGIEPNEAARGRSIAKGLAVEPGSFELLPVRSSSTDVLFALDVLEHCEDDAAALAEARRVLRPGGLIILTVPALPALWSRWDEVNAHHRRYVRDGLIGLVRAAGFEPIRTTYFNMFLLPIGWAVRKLSRPSDGQPPPGADLPPRPVNALFRGIIGLERRVLRHAGLPIGMSLLVVARRP